MEVLGVITARGGSKSILNKSIADCAGHPLMFYTIEAAKQATEINRLILSTDDKKFADLGRAYGVEVPFMRPAEFATDEATDIQVFEHALSELEIQESYRPDIIVHLRPTTPLKATADIDTAIAMLKQHPEATSVRSVCEPLHTPFKMYRTDGEFLTPILAKDYPEVFEKYPEAYNMPRQLLPKVWRHSGYIDVVRARVVSNDHSMSGNQILPFPFDPRRDIDIDSPLELQLATRIIEEMRKKGKEPWMEDAF